MDLDDPANDPVLQPDGRWLYTIHALALKNCILRIEKDTYFPFIGSYSLNVHSINDPEQFIDLGRIGLLNEVKEDALILSWQDHPCDLDLRLKCPNDEVIGIRQSDDASEFFENYYGRVSVDSTTGRGPETVVINHWTDFDSRFKIGGDYKLYVNWYRDEIEN